MSACGSVLLKFSKNLVYMCSKSDKTRVPAIQQQQGLIRLGGSCGVSNVSTIRSNASSRYLSASYLVWWLFSNFGASQCETNGESHSESRQSGPSLFVPYWFLAVKELTSSFPSHQAAPLLGVRVCGREIMAEKVWQSWLGLKTPKFKPIRPLCNLRTAELFSGV